MLIKHHSMHQLITKKLSFIHCTSCGTPLGFLSAGMSKKPNDFQFCNEMKTQGLFLSSYK
jgi:hypothetical protein